MIACNYTPAEIENWIAPKKLCSKVRMGAQGWLTNEKNAGTFLSTNVLLRKLAFCKEVIIWTLRPPTASKLKRRSSYFFILVLYTKFHSNPMMGTPSNSNFLSWNLAFSSNFCCGRKKPKATNALFEWFRLKIKGATLETNSFFLKMVILKIFFQAQNQLI